MSEKKLAIQEVYPEDYAWCYGCGRLNDKGHHFKTYWEGDHTKTVYQPESEHTAVPGFVYGGILASLIDCAGTGSASFALHRKNGHDVGDGVLPPRFVTASLNVTYLKPTPHGVPLTAIGKVEEVHPKKFKVVLDVFANEEKCVTGEVVAVVMPETFMKNA